MVIREYKPEDCRLLAELFYDTVHTVNAKDYTKEQLDAWADGNCDLEKWNQSFQEHYTVVAVEKEQAVGFGDMDTTGYLDRLYVHKDVQGKGVATAICDALESKIRQDKYMTHASITARKFFEKRGYRVVKEQQVERKGILLKNYVMEKERTQFAWIVGPLIQWYRKKARVLPWRENHDPYRVWVSEIMLQQTRVEAVIPYYHRFMEYFPNVKSLALAQEETVLKLWEGLGYYSRARNLKKAAEMIYYQFDGIFPCEYESIRKLPGIGKYTAGAVSSIAFGQPHAAVDGNVLRVITRLGEIGIDIKNEKFKNSVSEMLEEIYPAGLCSEFTQSLMELGAVVCVPGGEPKCNECPLKEGCRAYQNDSWQHYPVKSAKAERKKIHKTVLILSLQGKTAVKKREEQGLLAGLWELPNTDKKMNAEEIKQWLEEQGIEVTQIKKHKNAKHVFTHLEWYMYCYDVVCTTEGSDFNWVSEEELEDTIPLPTAFRKCL